MGMGACVSRHPCRQGGNWHDPLRQLNSHCKSQEFFYKATLCINVLSFFLFHLISSDLDMYLSVALSITALINVGKVYTGSSYFCVLSYGIVLKLCKGLSI